LVLSIWKFGCYLYAWWMHAL